MKLKDLRVDMWVTTTAGYGQITRVGGTFPPSVRVKITEPFPLGTRVVRPRDVLREGK